VKFAFKILIIFRLGGELLKILMPA